MAVSEQVSHSGETGSTQKPLAHTLTYQFYAMHQLFQCRILLNMELVFTLYIVRHLDTRDMSNNLYRSINLFSF